MNAILRSALPLAATLAVALPSAGCLIHSDSKTEQTGQHVSEETLSKVRPGQSQEYVLTLLGEPTERTPVEQGREVWKWRYSTVQRSGGGVFLIVSSSSRKESTGAVFVEFQDGVVSSSWRD